MSLLAIGASIEEVFAAVEAQEFYPLLKIAEDRSQIVAVTPMIFTTAIIYGVDAFGMSGRYCYATPESALAAFVAWSGNQGTEPEGWHRHPESGRRRPDGDATREYVHG